MTPPQGIRVRFEAASPDLDLRTTSSGNYKSAHTQQHWNTWQGAYQAGAAEQAERVKVLEAQIAELGAVLAALTTSDESIGGIRDLQRAHYTIASMEAILKEKPI